MGSAETASWLWWATAQSAGLGDQTRVHGVGDGAPWIGDKFQENFGEQGRYLLDFYDVSEYLAATPAGAPAGEQSGGCITRVATVPRRRGR